MRLQSNELGKRKDDWQKHTKTRENELKISGCHVLETVFRIKVAAAINSA